MKYEKEKSDEFFNIWEGIFDQFPESDPELVFESEQWVNRQQSPINNDEEETISTHTLIHEYPLAPIVAQLASELDNPLKILDFGGGAGSSFLPLIRSLPEPGVVEFHVVESSAICQRGRAIYNNFKNIYFHQSLPRRIKKFDLVHAAASLHYISDWRYMIAKFSEYEPYYIMLSGLTAGDIKTFVTYQNYYKSKIPVWFWNINEVINELRQVSYKLIYKSLLASTYLGKKQKLPMKNFPSEYRLPRKCNLLFKYENSQLANGIKP